MIVSIEGKLVTASPVKAVLERQGIGYEVHVPVTTSEKLPSPGQNVKLHTYVAYREDSQTLYGFASASERDFFRLLVEKVSGVGPRVALSIMSKLSLRAIRTAIASGDVALLAKSPGIGKKTAERLVIELRDKVGLPGVSGGAAPLSDASFPEPESAGNTSYHDAMMALISLGYKPGDADKALRKAAEKLGGKATTEALIKQALA